MLSKTYLTKYSIKCDNTSSIFYLKFLVIGVWYLRSSDNMEQVLELFGVGKNTASMVLEADMMLSLQEDTSYEWWIRYEYWIKGKTILGLELTLTN